MQTLPAPADPRVKLEPMPARRFLVVTFSGIARDDSIASKTDELRQSARA
nr:heme-binding protein [Rhodoblastus acidophilus]